MQRSAFSLIELLVSAALVVLVGVLAAPAVSGAYKSCSLAISANNLRQFSVGAAAYLADNNYRFWPFVTSKPAGTVWWFGLEPCSSIGKPEGQREIDLTDGPLANYLPRRIAPDPSFSFTGKPFKPKFKFGYIGIGYNVLLAGGWTGSAPPMKYWELEKPAEVVVFATSAQLNTFQCPASLRNPMIEEFYGIDDRETTVHFRHNGQAMVAFANGSAGFLPMDPTTRDKRAPDASVGRFAPKGSKKYLR